MNTGNTSEKVILALDGLMKDQALDLVKKVGQRVYAVKVHTLCDKHGPSALDELFDAGATRLWVDYKFHDIPNTVDDRADIWRDNGAPIVSIHALGGPEMMSKAVASSVNVYAITVLTSLQQNWLDLVFGKSAEDLALILAQEANKLGVTGVVCSPQEVGFLSSHPDLKGLEFIVPGSRSVGVAANDQKRVDTPSNALRNGATRLVIGRQITQAKDPVAALNLLAQEIADIG